MASPRHRDIHHTPLFRVRKSLLFRRDERKQRVINDLRWKASPTAVGIQENHVISFEAFGSMDCLEINAKAGKAPP